jgi:cytochrome c-type biogenesis protein CcmH/NrfG
MINLKKSVDRGEPSTRAEKFCSCHCRRGPCAERKTSIDRVILGLSLCVWAFLITPAWAEENVLTPARDVPSGISIEENSPLHDARQAYDAGQWRQARRKAKEFLGDNGNSAEGWTLLAKTYLATGSYKKAFNRFNKALKFDPHYAPAYVGRGHYFEKKGRLDEAANDYRAAILSDPVSVEAKQALDRLAGKTPSEVTSPTVTFGNFDDPGSPTETTSPTDQ